MRQIITLLLLVITFSAVAQDESKLFGGGDAPRSRKGLIINGNGGFDIPGGDLAKRFGYSYRVGPAVLYKTTSNWVFGVKCDFILGNIVKQDSLMINIRDRYSGYNTHLYEFINNNGERIGVEVYERGYNIALQFGRIFAFSDSRPDNGLMVLGSLGFLQHKIDIFDKDKSIPQLQGAYLKGYDRLTNGASIDLYAGYTYFAKNGLINFTIGLDAMIAFTQDRRSYLYDEMRTDNQQRADILYGLRAGWFIPVFKKRSEDMSFQ